MHGTPSKSAVFDCDVDPDVPPHSTATEPDPLKPLKPFFLKLCFTFTFQGLEFPPTNESLSGIFFKPQLKPSNQLNGLFLALNGGRNGGCFFCGICGFLCFFALCFFLRVYVSTPPPNTAQDMCSMCRWPKQLELNPLLNHIVDPEMFNNMVRFLNVFRNKGFSGPKVTFGEWQRQIGGSSEPRSSTNEPPLKRQESRSEQTTEGVILHLVCY